MEKNKHVPIGTDALKLKSSCSAATTIMCCEFNRDGSLIAVGTIDGTITIFQCSSGATVYRLHPGHSMKLPVTSVRFVDRKAEGHESILIASYATGLVCKWHVSTGQCLCTIDEDCQSLAAAVAPCAITFSTAGSDGKLRLYDMASGELIRTLESSMSASVMDGHVSRVFALTYHPSDPNTLLSAGWDDTVQIWDARKEHSVRKLSGPHICGDGLDIHSTSLNIITGSWRYHDTIQVWDFKSGNLLSTCEPEIGTKVYAVRWVGDKVLLGGSKEHIAMLLNANSGKVLGKLSQLQSGVYSVDYVSSTNEVAVVSGSDLYFMSLHVA